MREMNSKVLHTSANTNVIGADPGIGWLATPGSFKVEIIKGNKSITTDSTTASNDEEWSWDTH